MTEAPTPDAPTPGAPTPGAARPAPGFASQGDLGDKTITFQALTHGCYAFTAEGDPNSGVIIGSDGGPRGAHVPGGVMVIDAQATPVMATSVLDRIATVTEQAVSHVLLTHYHAVRVLGASAYQAHEILASHKTWEMIEERGAQDYASEVGRFPRLFRAVDSIPGLTWPTQTFTDAMTLWLGQTRVEILQPGEGHTRGDTIAWVPEGRVLFAGDLVEYGATPYCGDAQLARWPATLERLSALQPEYLVPGRGAALAGRGACQEAIRLTKGYVQMLYDQACLCVARGLTLRQSFETIHAAMAPLYGDWVIFEHCMPFNVARAYDEAMGIAHPRIWTDARDQALWAELRG